MPRSELAGERLLGNFVVQLQMGHGGEGGEGRVAQCLLEKVRRWEGGRGS